MKFDNEENATPNDIQTAVAAGVELAGINDRIMDIDDIPFALVPDGMTIDVLTRVIDERDKRAARPPRLKGTALHQELESFMAHVNRFKDAHSAVWADNSAVKLTAVLNYHEKPEREPVGEFISTSPQRWGDHRSVYSCPLSDQWKLWIEHNGKLMGQEEFGEFIEANMRDLAGPNPDNEDDDDMAKPAAVLEMARNLVVRTKGDFQRSVNPTTGESSLTCKTENESTSTKIPRGFLLGIPVFEAGTLYRVEARLRFLMQDGRPRFAYLLYQPDVIKRDAFDAVRKQVAAQTELPVFVGAPE